jgi:hypothetical protein
LFVVTVTVAELVACAPTAVGSIVPSVISEVVRDIDGVSETSRPVAASDGWGGIKSVLEVIETIKAAQKTTSKQVA